MSDDATILGVNDTLRVEDGKVYNVAEQEFDSSFWSGLQWARQQQHRHARLKDVHYIASVPAIFYHKWLNEGENPYLWDKKELFRRLYRDGLEDFIATEKRVI